MKDLGEAAYILGIKIYRDRLRRLIGLCQSAYIEKILKRYCVKNSKSGSIPMQEKIKLSKSQECNKMILTDPCDLHWTTIQNILKYLKNTKGMFLVYGGDLKRELMVSCYTDAGYLTDDDDLKLGVVPTTEEPISMYCDNTGAIAIANELEITNGVRHFHAKVHHLREVIEYGDIKLEKVHTDDNLVDPFTKALEFPKHSEHTRNIRMLPASSLM
uniref:Retrotransposon protein, putative, Ty1-copia subclass n=1 Tax=Tanacetum cinerariifolium TaxID=118510 RepID=A0A699JAR6_TANCI|nr:hypothetical protein [Tanacetum cinerariifolium]